MTSFRRPIEIEREREKEREREDGLKRDPVGSPVDRVFITELVVDMANETCNGSNGRRDLGDQYSSATATLDVMLVPHLHI